VRKVGLHLRFQTSLVDMINDAIRLDLDTFQCFLVAQSTHKTIAPSKDDIDAFLRIRRERFEDLYAHISYWVNLASLNYNGHRALQRELDTVKKLEMTHIVLHPGSANGASDRLQGIDALARSLNDFVKVEQEIVVLLENTAHGNLTVGSSLQDFYLLRKKLDQPEKVRFCIDTAHAYAYGYNIADLSEQESFIRLLDETVGISNIELFHLNDTKKNCGSRIDRHEMIGEGVIGQEALKSFVLHEKLIHIPLLMELPLVEYPDQKAMVQLVRSWHV